MSHNTKDMRLGDILTELQAEEVLSICKTTHPDDLASRLKKYLGQFEEQLKSKGVLPEYLAYLLYFKWQNGELKGATNGH